MPGAPNKPPETTAPPSSAPPPAETPAEHALRRLAPSRVALRLPIWRDAPSPELLGPLTEAERLFDAGDAAGANGALDRLSIRFAEPRWPSLPEPFRALRVPVPAPQPPHWDPDHALPPAEKELRRFRRYAAEQLTLARAALDAESSRGSPVGDLAPLLAEAESAARSGELGPAFWAPVDRLWRTLRERIPGPAGPARTPARATEAGPDGG